MTRLFHVWHRCEGVDTVALVQVGCFAERPLDSARVADRFHDEIERRPLDSCLGERRACGVGEVGGAVVEEQVGVESRRADVDRVGPFTCGVVGAHDEVAAAIDVRRDKVERAVVMAERRRENSARRPRVTEHELALAHETVPEAFPQDEVVAVIERDAGEVVERTRHEVVVVANPTVGVTTRKDWILVGHGRAYASDLSKDSGPAVRIERASRSSLTHRVTVVRA